MEDGYFDGNGRTKTILLCTECFTKDECLLLVDALAKLGIKSTLKVPENVPFSDRSLDTYRVRVSKTSMPLLRELVAPHMHPIFMYKLGPSLNLDNC